MVAENDELHAEKAGKRVSEMGINQEHRKTECLAVGDSTIDLLFEQGRRVKVVNSLANLCVNFDKKGMADAENGARKAND